MIESDDVLTLPVEGDGPERDPTAPRHGGGAAPVTYGGELVSLSAEARLATALLLQAQALEGMRHAQSDLLRRLEDGSGGAARRVADELHAGLKELQQAQQQTAAQIARARRRAGERMLLGVFVLLAVLGGGLWLVHAWNEQLAAAVEEARAQVEDAVGADRVALEDRFRAALAASSAEQAQSVGELTAALHATDVELRARLEATQQERDAARALAGDSQLSVAELARQLAEAQQSEESLARELERTRSERNQQIGEAVRARSQLVDAERRLAELTETMATLHEAQALRVAAPDGRIVTTQADPDSVARRVSQALLASGAEDVAVLEVDAVADGALTGVMLMLTRPSPLESRVLAAAEARLLALEGRAVLRLSEVRERGREELQPTLDIELPRLDPEAWRAAGVAPPDGFTPVPLVADALGALLAPHGYRVVGLRSFDGEALGELELRQEDASGLVLRTLRATRGEVLPVGPELVLQDGSISIAGDERPFFMGEYRLALPGSDFGAWLSAVVSPSP